ncbi:PREDICTED: UBX domain-containing protein 6 [Tinamus guttatus]|uniref:UBX domain-containing protein 6 n=1 Tax=Tinamus guttatus TaxID=94827 RepID=UPI00052EE0F4|nr:PREDICTED: UBX domain-containing protein 6 [Tinamus guttatus]
MSRFLYPNPAISVPLSWYPDPAISVPVSRSRYPGPGIPLSRPGIPLSRFWYPDPAIAVRLSRYPDPSVPVPSGCPPIPVRVSRFRVSRSRYPGPGVPLFQSGCPAIPVRLSRFRYPDPAIPVRLSRYPGPGVPVPVFRSRSPGPGVPVPEPPCSDREEEEEEAAGLSVPGVYFSCPLTGAVVRKGAKDKHIREAILAYFSVDPVAASIMEIHTFNKDREKVRVGVETMARYLDNIYLHPEEEKYRKIKLQNKVFQERISCLEGTHKFFQAVGFETKTLPIPEQETTEEYYVLKEEMLSRLEDLKDYKEQLLSSEPVRARLERQLSVFKPSLAAARFELPNDFYNLTAEEIKREQRLRSEAVEKASMLRTRAMRERDEQREMRKYNYTLLRVRFPDGYILQGTFYARESISVLYSFVREALVNDWLPFELLGPGGVKLTDETLAFNECGLVPSSLLTLVWDASVMADIQAAGEEQPTSPLKPQLLSQVQTLS